MNTNFFKLENNYEKYEDNNTFCSNSINYLNKDYVENLFTSINANFPSYDLNYINSNNFSKNQFLFFILLNSYIYLKKLDCYINVFTKSNKNYIFVSKRSSFVNSKLFLLNYSHSLLSCSLKGIKASSNEDKLAILLYNNILFIDLKFINNLENINAETHSIDILYQYSVNNTDYLFSFNPYNTNSFSLVLQNKSSKLFSEFLLVNYNYFYKSFESFISSTIKITGVEYINIVDFNFIDANNDYKVLGWEMFTVLFLNENGDIFYKSPVFPIIFNNLDYKKISSFLHEINVNNLINNNKIDKNNLSNDNYFINNSNQNLSEKLMEYYTIKCNEQVIKSKEIESNDTSTIKYITSFIQNNVNSYYKFNINFSNKYFYHTDNSKKSSNPSILYNRLFILENKPLKLLRYSIQKNMAEIFMLIDDIKICREKLINYNIDELNTKVDLILLKKVCFNLKSEFYSLYMHKLISNSYNKSIISYIYDQNDKEYYPICKNNYIPY